MHHKLSHFVFFVNSDKFQAGVTTVFCYRSNITDLSSRALSFVLDKIHSEYKNIQIQVYSKSYKFIQSQIMFDGCSEFVPT